MSRLHSALWIATTLAGLFLVGCKSTPPPKCLEDHMVVSDHAGSPIHPLTEYPLLEPCAEFRRILAKAETVCEQRWKTAQEAHGKKLIRKDRLLVHIHGGLNDLSQAQSTTDDAIKRMDRLYFDRLGTDPKSAYEEWHYPIFLAWPSDALSTATDRVFFIRQGHRWPILGPITSPFVLAADVGKAVASAPINVPYTLLSDAGLGLNVATGQHPGPSWKRAEDLYLAAHRRGFNVSIGPYSRGWWNQAGRMVSYIVTLPAKISSQVLLLEGIGRGAWDVMQRRANATVYAEEEFEGRLSAEADMHFGEPARGAFGQFFHCLIEHAERAGAPELELTFAAHSTGAVPFNHLLLYYAHKEGAKLPVKRVIYMAPACSSADAVEALRQAFERFEGMRFHLVTLHPQADADEAQWGVLDLPPRGSLLEWIDNFFSTPVDHGARVFGKWVNAIQAIHLFGDVKDRVTFKAFPVDGTDVPTRHGGFNTRNFWTKEFYWQP